MKNSFHLISNEAALVVNHVSMVEAIADKFITPRNIDRYDLISVGYEALIYAAHTYDKTKGSFASYAKTCISNAMKDEIRKYRPRFEAELDNEEVSEDGNNCWNPYAKAYKPRDIEEWAYDTEDSAYDTDDWAAESEIRAEETVDQLLQEAGLTPREKYVINHLFGLDDCLHLTSKQLAAEFGLTQQMIIHIKNKALAKMRLAARQNRTWEWE